MMPPSRLHLLHLSSSTAPPSEAAAIRRAAEGMGASLLDPAAAEAGSNGETGPLVVLAAAEDLEAAAGRWPAAALVCVVEDGAAGAPPGDRIVALARRPITDAVAREALARGAAHALLLAELHRLRRQVAEQGRELRELNRIGAALTSERDTERLLTLILTKCREITSSDAGSLYLVEKRPGAEPDVSDPLADKSLVFRLAQNDSVSVPFEASSMEISRRSLAGYVALTGEVLAIEDAYAIGDDAEYRFNSAFDTSSGYLTRSLLVLPMHNHKDEVIGVLQLINRKRDRAARLDGPGKVEEQVISFDRRARDLALSLSSQAAVAIENARLYEEIQRLFEGFIRASVTAIEARDPTTSGHSERVALFTVGLAEAVDREERGPLRDVRFSRAALREIQYASLLHDFGKIGVREDVLLKSKKLYDGELRAIRDRFALLRRSLELKYSREKLRHFMDRTREEALASAAALDGDLAAKLADLDRYLEAVVQANEPSILEAEGAALLRVVGATTIEDVDRGAVPLLQPWESANLSIGKGSLSPEERLEIESHVSHTFEFLSTIPWTRELRGVPEIAYAHHEKLDGTGYPRAIRAEAIPLESRMMTVCDIFDALTAKDRPYKRSMPVQRALDILAAEVREGKVDSECFRLFVEARVFDLAASKEGPIA